MFQDTCAKNKLPDNKFNEQMKFYTEMDSLETKETKWFCFKSYLL